MEAAYAGTGVRALGIYHEHPAGTREPSEKDLRSWTAAAEMADDGTFLGVIVANPEHPAATRMQVRAWTVIDGCLRTRNRHQLGGETHGVGQSGSAYRRSGRFTNRESTRATGPAQAPARLYRVKQRRHKNARRSPTTPGAVAGATPKR
jgi:hypothetical protein